MRRLSGRNSSVLAAAARLAHPGFVVQHVDDARLAGLGSSVTSQRSLLSAERARGHGRGGRPSRPPASTSGSRARRAGRARASRRRLSGCRRRRRSPASSTGGAKLPSAHTVLPVLRLRMASRRRSCVSPTFVRAGNVLGVAALGHVVRHDRALRAGGTLGDEDEDVRVVGRQHQVGGASADPAARRPAACPFAFSSAFCFSSFCSRMKLDQLLFLLADELLAVGEPRLGLLGRDVGELRDERRPLPPAPGR